MPISVNVGGTWKTVDVSKVNVGGTWKDVSSVHVNVGGVWKEVVAASSLSVVLTATTDSVYGTDFTNPYSAQAGYRVNSDGNLERFYTSGGSLIYETVEAWLESGSAADVDMKIEHNSGDTISGGITAGTWYNCASSRSFWMEDTTADSTPRGGTYTITWALASNHATVFDTIEVYMEAGAGF
jgi:hypothetical protein